MLSILKILKKPSKHLLDVNLNKIEIANKYIKDNQKDKKDKKVFQGDKIEITASS